MSKWHFSDDFAGMMVRCKSSSRKPSQGNSEFHKRCVDQLSFTREQNAPAGEADSDLEQVMSALEKGTLVDVENSSQVGWKVAGDIPAHHSHLTED